MRLRHISSRLALSAATICILTATAHAGFGFGFGGGDEGKSGLDLNRGYDINTVTTVTGKVTSVPQNSDLGGVTLAIMSGEEIINLYVGPGAYWAENGIPVRLHDDISAKGSRSQGKDGKNYLLTQKLVNRSSGAQVDLRNEKGEAGWLGAELRPDRSSSPRDSRGGAAMRGGGAMRSGGGIMRGGGGGMMRR